MDHSRAVNVRQPLRQWDGYRQQVGLRERLTRGLTLPEQLRQRQTLHELHDQIGRAVGPEELPAVHDAGMLLEFDQCLRLFPEEPQPIGEVGLALRPLGADRRALAYSEFRREVLLDRHDTVQLVVACLIDDSEPAVPEHLFDGVVAEYPPLRQRVPTITPGVWHETSLPQDSCEPCSTSL